MTGTEAAKLLGVHISTLRRWAQREVISWEWDSRGRRVYGRRDIEALASARRHPWRSLRHR